MAVDLNPAPSTIHQIVDKDGNPYQATGTSNVWVGGAVFSGPTQGNQIKAFLSGKEYFDDLIAEFEKAEKEICMVGWQVSWDALLAPGVRLYDVTLKAAQKGVHVYVMPWNDTNPIQTYDDQTKTVLESINKRPEVNAKRVHVRLAKSLASVNNAYFSHHQKQVVVDRKVAYLGGMDICYGRFDDATYDLHADKDGRQGLNRYNGCIPGVKTLNMRKDQIVDPDLMTGAMDKYSSSSLDGKTSADRHLERVGAGGWQTKYQTPGVVDIGANSPSIDSNDVDLTTLDAQTQPRMPWQDLHSRIEGPAVSDLLRNFILRWNATGGKRLEPAPVPGAYPKPGNTHVQVLRSAPSAMIAAEKKGAICYATQDDIHQAMVQLIAKANHFIYIENQFFVSDFGSVSGVGSQLSPAAQFIKTGAAGLPDWKLFGVRKLYQETTQGDIDGLPQNKVCAALIQRIRKSILNAKQPNFHVYITLPVHPEGPLNDAAVAVQVWWTMQTIAFGSKSLLNGIRRALKARELHDKGDNDFMRVVNDDANTEYESIDLKACFKYVTLLNLRNWAKLGDRYVTEQVYVHTKLMIVDDMYALYGSANINDRSQLGERDSEIAVLVMDGDASRADINGAGSNKPVRKFAHELRKNIWKKLFGITGNVRPAQNLLKAIDAPGSPDSWKLIQAQAEKNTAAYEAAFDFVPRNYVKDALGQPVTSSIIPTWIPDPTVTENADWHKRGKLAAPMPFQVEFWSGSRHNAGGVERLDEIKGFITTLPIHWTEGENIRYELPTAAVAVNEVKEKNLPDAQAGNGIKVATASPSSQPSSVAGES